MNGLHRQEVTWEQAMTSEERLVPENPAWETPVAVAPVAIPGQTKFT